MFSFQKPFIPTESHLKITKDCRYIMDELSETKGAGQSFGEQILTQYIRFCKTGKRSSSQNTKNSYHDCSLPLLTRKFEVHISWDCAIASKRQNRSFSVNDFTDGRLDNKETRRVPINYNPLVCVHMYRVPKKMWSI